ncbi:D-alanyl-D-alanine carboxypeptidase/D-alanyl-D-alanine-endopeptidase [Cytobacillus sp. Sa5YUA1]|uniref:D-alanyl-D-alanine carboxypeptidase/D-alanyl-D-alanine-endopeptidase n=1 Tax=Cytobacillus stercorigallinarum TaxID=2762240 RepID=A0ABR8QQW4_9BACI|nr:D-alanyl-D-alanine carboxypeptidase/D-alanyl-D-alanine-endopeptidase [Cytobacillus stercorigallinarum]MBD7937672.1 D-alanyl-D-alanine carboxypeptidase/D-alanyl-D-alanine-endopeptidase [Cytobacillus stercorigallinarum]
MKKALVGLITVVLLLSIAYTPFQSAVEPQVSANEEGDELVQKLNQLINNDPLLAGALAGVSVRSADEGEIVYEHIADTRLRPASNMKLLTAAAALSVLGEDYRFKTELLSKGQQRGSVHHGDIYLKGYGDPTLMKEDFTNMAKALKKQGIKMIKGQLIADDSWYDDKRLSEDIVWNDESYYYGAQISALTASPNEDYDAGSVIVEVKSGKREGDKPEITLQPDNRYVKINNEAKTVGASDEKDIDIVREHGTNEITISGTIPLEATSSREWIAVWEPTQYAAALLQDSLADEGIKIHGGVKVGVAPEQTEVLFEQQSMPLKELLIPFMKLSNNTHAEILIKEMGKVVKNEGSWDAGLEVLANELKNWGVNQETTLLRDGSGISHVTLIPANELTKLLYEVQKESWFETYFQSLPVAGHPERMIGGTLRNRMKNSPAEGYVYAKTGSISTVSSLSGYVDNQSGERYVFSIVLNNMIDGSKGKIIEDKIATILAEQ